MFHVHEMYFPEDYSRNLSAMFSMTIFTQFSQLEGLNGSMVNSVKASINLLSLQV